MSGWIKLHRQFKDWEWYNKSEIVHLFIHCLVKANYKDGSFQGIECKKGEFITSLKHLSEETNISIQTIRTCLKKLILTNEINVKTTNKLTKITICKYESYQSDEIETNKQLTNKQQTTNKQLTTIKEYKERKEEKEDKTIPSIDEFLAYAISLKPNVNIENVKLKYNSWLVNDWKVNRQGKEKEIKNWKSTLSNTLQYLGEINIQDEVKINKPLRLKDLYE